jgi:hypothetical protein
LNQSDPDVRTAWQALWDAHEDAAVACGFSRTVFERHRNAIWDAIWTSAQAYLLAALRIAEWQQSTDDNGEQDGWLCADCDYHTLDDQRHDPGCLISAALTSAGAEPA